MKRVLDPIEEIDEEYAKECETQRSHSRRDTGASNAGDQSSKSIDAFAGSRDPNESNYQLRRTVKLINLHHEFNKEDFQVVLGPKRMDSSSSDSCDEDVIFAKTSNTNKSKDVATNNDSLIHSTN